MKIYYGMGSGLRQNLDIKDFKYLPILVPPIDEQHAIVRFLDHIDRRINHYIRSKRKLIVLLNEQKQTSIYRAVTRGLDPSVRLKPSGVEWLGTFRRIGRCADCDRSRISRLVVETQWISRWWSVSVLCTISDC